MNELKELLVKGFNLELDDSQDAKPDTYLFNYEYDVTDALNTAMQLIETYTDKKCLEALEQVSFDMYDINDLEWGIPTKWSVKDENDNHADLWIPQESAVEKIQYRINQLSTQLTNKEMK